MTQNIKDLKPDRPNIITTNIENAIGFYRKMDTEAIVKEMIRWIPNSQKQPVLIRHSTIVYDWTLQTMLFQLETQGVCECGIYRGHFSN